MKRVDLLKPGPVVRLLDTDKAAEYLGLSPRTLRNWRYESRGPKVTAMDRTIRYDLQDLDAWIEEHKKAG